MDMLRGRSDGTPYRSWWIDQALTLTQDGPCDGRDFSRPQPFDGMGQQFLRGSKESNGVGQLRM